MIATATELLKATAPQTDLAEFCCQNSGCPSYRQRGAGNIRVDSHYGRSRIRLLCCRVCGTRFSERKGSRLFGSQLAPETVDLLFRALEQGCGIRETARLLKLNRNTVTRYSRILRIQSNSQGQPGPVLDGPRTDTV